MVGSAAPPVHCPASLGSPPTEAPGQRAVMNESVSPGKGLCLALCCIPRAWLGGCAITGEQGWKGNSTITFHFNGHLSASKHMAAKKQYWKGYRQNIKVIKWLEEDVKKDSLRKSIKWKTWRRYLKKNSNSFSKSVVVELEARIHWSGCKNRKTYIII